MTKRDSGGQVHMWSMFLFLSRWWRKVVGIFQLETSRQCVLKIAQVDMANRLAGDGRRLNTGRVGDEGTQHLHGRPDHESDYSSVGCDVDKMWLESLFPTDFFQIRNWTFETTSAHLGKTGAGTIISIWQLHNPKKPTKTGGSAANSRPQRACDQRKCKQRAGKSMESNLFSVATSPHCKQAMLKFLIHFPSQP